MSIYNFSRFKNSKFGETITYTSSGASPFEISAVVFRNSGLKKISGGRSTEIQQYPVTVELDTADIATVTVNEDKISCRDINGQLKTYRVSRIIYSDAGCFKLGLGL